MPAAARPALLAALTLSAILLAGCHSKFTRERFEMISPGVDDREDVRAILGKPEAELYDQWFYDDMDRHLSAVIHFDDDGRVMAKEWMNANTGEWEGRNPHAAPSPAGAEPRESRTRTTRIKDD